jgi:hypothetical protein
MKNSYDANRQSWTVEIQQDGKEYFIELTDEMLESVGWKIGDTLVWERAPGNAWTVRKKP